MEYRKEVSKHRVMVTSVLKGLEPDKRIIGTEIKESKDKSFPLVRTYSRFTGVHGGGEGKYRVAYKHDGAWFIIEDHQFVDARHATKYLDGLHLLFEEVAVVQDTSMQAGKGPWMGLDKHDPDDYREDTGEENV